MEHEEALQAVKMEAAGAGFRGMRGEPVLHGGPPIGQQAVYVSSETHFHSILQ